MRSDETKRGICIAAIKRHTIEQDSFRFTTVHEFDTIEGLDPQNELMYEEDELPIASVVIDNEHWSLLTTRRVITNRGGDLRHIYISPGIKYNWGPFKKSLNGYVIAEFNSSEGKVEVFVEEGKAAMTMVYGAMTLSGLI